MTCKPRRGVPISSMRATGPALAAAAPMSVTAKHGRKSGAHRASITLECVRSQPKGEINDLRANLCLFRVKCNPFGRANPFGQAIGCRGYFAG
jgi:hypothetical protein